MRPSHLIALTAPSDFFLFGWFKGELTRQTLARDEELFDEVNELLKRRSSETIIGVSREWINKRKDVISLDSEDIS